MNEDRPVPLRRNHGFRMLWIGQVLSATGTEAALIAYPLLILALTHSVVLADVVSTVQLAAQLVLSLPGGALADRLDRRLTMIACDSVRAAVLGLLVVLVLTHLVTWPIVLAVALVDDAANVLFSPSANAALPAIVADEQLEQAWAATEGRTYAAALVGPALGGFLFGLGRAVPFLVDVASYLPSGWPRRESGPAACSARWPRRGCRDVCRCGGCSSCSPWAARRCSRSCCEPFRRTCAAGSATP
jgi:MFS family permease